MSESYDLAVSTLRTAMTGVVGTANAVAQSAEDLGAANSQVAGGTAATSAQAAVATEAAEARLAHHPVGRRRRRADGRLDP